MSQINKLNKKEELIRLLKNPSRKELNRRHWPGKIQYVASQVCIVRENSVEISLVKIYHYILRIIHGKTRVDEHRFNEKLQWEDQDLKDKTAYFIALSKFMSTFCNQRLYEHVDWLIWRAMKKKFKREFVDEYYSYFTNVGLTMISRRVRKELQNIHDDDVKAPSGAKKLKSNVPLKF
jgi:hypothetical protein